MNWNASWYGDCVSLVVSSSYGGTDAPFYQGWCFDFESGNQLTVTQMLQRMGADPAALEEALYRDVKRRDELDRQAACERGLLPPDSLKEGNTAWWTTLDELPFSLDGKGNVSFVVRRSSAAQEQYTDDKVTIPLDAQPLPPDWEWQVLAEWMAVTAVTQGESRRCDRLGRGKKSGLEPDKSQRGRQKQLDHLHDGGPLAADAVHRPQKGQ